MKTSTHFLCIFYVLNPVEMCFSRKCVVANESDRVSPILSRENSDTSSERDYPESIVWPNTAQSRRMHVSIVRPWVHHTLNKGVSKLRDEFSEVANKNPNVPVDAFKSNPEKNRYTDIKCIEKTRVILTTDGASSDYIHANYVGISIKPKKFICTQGPKDSTIYDFWAMVIQDNVESIIMLCKVIELARVKCEQYWPAVEGQTNTYVSKGHTITINNLGVGTLSPDDDFINVTNLELVWAGKTRSITHYQWTNWPDHGAPPINMGAINLIEAVNYDTNPVVVHCSAGVGRSGTIVGISLIMDKMIQGINCKDMKKLVEEIRNQRHYAIQTEAQYMYIHRVLLEYFLELHKETYEGLLLTKNYEEKYAKWLDDYNTYAEANDRTQAAKAARAAL